MSSVSGGAVAVRDATREHAAQLGAALAGGARAARETKLDPLNERRIGGAVSVPGDSATWSVMPVRRSSSVTSAGGGEMVSGKPRSAAPRSIRMIARMPGGIDE